MRLAFIAPTLIAACGGSTAAPVKPAPTSEKPAATSESPEESKKPLGELKAEVTEDEMERARRLGVLGALERKEGGAFASLTGTSDFECQGEKPCGLAGEAVVTAEEPTAVGDAPGGLDKHIIRRKVPRVRYCYEKALAMDPRMKEARVVVDFEIAPTGDVANSNAAGANNAELEQCIADVIAKTQFPKPKGGGRVKVRYPFLLRPAKSEPALTPKKSRGK